MTYDLIIQYNNVGTPFLKFIYKSNDNTSVAFINFTELTNGLPTNREKIIDIIKENFSPVGKRCLLLLNCDEIFNSLSEFPNLNLRRSKQLFNKQFNEEFPSTTDFKHISYEFDVSNNSIYIRHFLPVAFLDSLDQFIKDCGFTACDYDLLGLFLAKQYNKLTNEEDFLLLYQENEMVYLNLIYQNSLIHSQSFINNEKLFNRYILSCFDSFNNKLGNNKINKIYTNIEGEFTRELNAEIVPYQVGFVDYEARKF